MLLRELSGCIERCRACEHRAFTREESEAQKRGWLRKALGPWSGELEEVRGSDSRLGYRDKTTLRARWGGERWEFGTRARKSGSWREYELVAIPDCPVHTARVSAILAALSTGLVEPLPLAFVAIAGSLVTLVLKSAQERPVEALFRADGFQELAKAGAAGLFLNLNPSAGDRVFASRGWRLIWGEGSARDEDGLLHGPESFHQLLPELHRSSIVEAGAFLAPGSGDLVFDLYSGIGVSLKHWRERGAECIGVELGGDAVACLEANAGPGLCLRGRVSERLPQLERKRAAHAGRTLVYANPPRIGMEPEAARWIAESLRPARIAYLSCSAGTLARDLSILAAADYVVRRIIPYDFFPQTRHIEALALLELDADRVRARGPGSGGDARSH